MAINTAIVLGAARGIIPKTKRTVLAEYGGDCLAHADTPILHQLKNPICSSRRGIHEHNTLSIDMFTALILDTLFKAHAHASAVRGKYFLVINLTEFLHYRANLNLSIIFPVENYPLYGIVMSVVNTVTLNEQVAYKRGVAGPQKWRPVYINYCQNGHLAKAKLLL